MSLNYKKFFQSTFDIRRDEVIVILTNPATDSRERYEMAVRWWDGLAKLAAEVGAVVLPLVTYPDTGAHGAPLPEYSRMGERDVPTESVLAVATLALALTAHSATGPLMDRTKRYPWLRAASLPGVLPEMEDTALREDPNKLVSRNRILRSLLDAAVIAQIEFSNSDRLTIDLRPNVSLSGNSNTNVAHTDDGFLPPDAKQRVINLPSGEVWRCPFEEEDPSSINHDPERQSRTDGILPVADTDGDIRLIVRRGRIVEVEGTSTKSDIYRHLFSVDPVRRNIAEFGLGSNSQAIVRGVVLEDEKAGPHIAYGRSDYLGGLISVSHFARPENVLHTDIVYARHSPINIKKMTITSNLGEECVVIADGEYTVF